jgi:steroid delta-isomerase-like uncharacterized protein
MSRILAVMSLCIAIGLIGSQVRADDAQNRCARIGQKWVDFWSGHDVTTAFDVFTEDIVYEDIPTGVVVRGADEFTEFAQGFFDANPILRFALVQSACRGQQGFIEWTAIGLDAPGYCGTGKSITTRGVAIIAIQGKRISRSTDYWDLFSDLRQLLPEGQECVARLLGLSEE